MFVSKSRYRDNAGPRVDPGQAEALIWLRGQLAWEELLGRLRQEAGVEPGRIGAAGRDDQSHRAA